MNFYLTFFSKVEDRRRRAETMVQKQSAFIDELKRELASVRTESRKKIVSLDKEDPELCSLRHTVGKTLDLI